MLRTLSIFTFIVFSNIALSQKDSVFLLNGLVVNSVVTDSTSESVTIQHLTRAGKTVSYDKDQLYKIRFSSGSEKYYYQQDSSSGNWMSREDAWMFIKGENDARKGYKANAAYRGAIIFGLLGGLTGSFWGPLAPYAFIAINGISSIKIDRATVSDISYLKSEPYLLGYVRVGRQKQKTRALLGGLIGLAAGYAGYGGLNQFYPSSINVGFGK
jgi:hypothetical protein